MPALVVVVDHHTITITDHTEPVPCPSWLSLLAPAFPLIGQAPTLLGSHWSRWLLREHSYAIKNQHWPFAGSLWQEGAYNRSFPPLCRTEMQEMPQGRFWMLEQVLYGIRMLAEIVSILTLCFVLSLSLSHFSYLLEDQTDRAPARKL